MILKPQAIIVVPQYERTDNRQYPPSAGKFDLSTTENKTKGHISDNSIRRMRYAIQMLSTIATTKQSTNPSSGRKYTWKLNFITLTLPSEQGAMSDADCKRLLLMPFLQQMKRKFGLRSYVWKAEPQANENMHFHLTTDTYLPHLGARAEWNKILARYGYITKYRSNQEKWHKYGFKSRPELFSQWSLKSQRAAYVYGKKTNWSNPNSIDVHPIWQIESITAYLIDYFCKKEKGKRFIEGKLYGCSENLSYKHKCQMQANPELYQELDDLKVKHHCHVISEPYYTVICIGKVEKRHAFGIYLKSLWDNHIVYIRHYASMRGRKKAPPDPIPNTRANAPPPAQQLGFASFLV